MATNSHNAWRVPCASQNDSELSGLTLNPTVNQLTSVIISQGECLRYGHHELLTLVVTNSRPCNFSCIQFNPVATLPKVQLQTSMISLPWVVKCSNSDSLSLQTLLFKKSVKKFPITDTPWVPHCKNSTRIPSYLYICIPQEFLYSKLEPPILVFCQIQHMLEALQVQQLGVQ